MDSSLLLLIYKLKDELKKSNEFLMLSEEEKKLESSSIYKKAKEERGRIESSSLSDETTIELVKSQIEELKKHQEVQNYLKAYNAYYYLLYIINKELFLDFYKDDQSAFRKI